MHNYEYLHRHNVNDANLTKKKETIIELPDWKVGRREVKAGSEN